jgi:hypothetical protein
LEILCTTFHFGLITKGFALWSSLMDRNIHKLIQQKHSSQYCLISMGFCLCTSILEFTTSRYGACYLILNILFFNLKFWTLIEFVLLAFGCFFKFWFPYLLLFVVLSIVYMTAKEIEELRFDSWKDSKAQKIQKQLQIHHHSIWGNFS